MKVAMFVNRVEAASVLLMLHNEFVESSSFRIQNQ